MTLLTVKAVINRICSLFMILGIPCLIIWIILIIRNKSNTSKIRWIILVCLMPAAIIIRFLSSILFRSIWTRSYENQPQILTPQPVIQSENWRAIPNHNQ